jgi:DNA-binding transcriptional LysR family regulator
VEYPGDVVLHLESFVSLLSEIRRGRAGAFEQTARKLGVDRSVLRRRIRTLDAWIGTPLLAGRGAMLTPSPAGRRLAERAERLLAGVRQLRADVALARDRVTIGCTGTITTELLPRVLVSLEKRPKPVQLVIRRAGGALCESLLASGDIDLGVVRADEPPKGFAHRHLTDDRLWFVLPARHALAKATKLTLAQMASVPLVLYGESSRTRARVMERLAPHGASIRVEVEGRAAALEYVRAGIGATFLSLLPGHAPPRHALDVTSQFPRSRFYVIARPDRWDDPIVRDVVTELSERRPR